MTTIKKNLDIIRCTHDELFGNDIINIEPLKITDGALYFTYDRGGFYIGNAFNTPVPIAYSTKELNDRFNITGLDKININLENIQKSDNLSDTGLVVVRIGDNTYKTTLYNLKNYFSAGSGATAAKTLVFDSTAQIQEWLDGNYQRPDEILPSELVIGQFLFTIPQEENNYWVGEIPVVGMSSLVPFNEDIDISNYYNKSEIDTFNSNTFMLIGENFQTLQTMIMTTEDMLNTELLNKVGLSGNQDISGDKNFIETLKYKGEEVATKKDLSTVFTYQGSKETYEDLLLVEDMKIGDTWNIIADGKNHAWDGEQWDDLSGITDLSNYYDKNEIDYKIITLDNRVDNFNQSLNGRIDGVEGNTNGRFTAVHSEMDARFTGMQGQMDSRFQAVSQELDSRFTPVNNQITNLNHKTNHLIPNNMRIGYVLIQAIESNNKVKFRNFHNVELVSLIALEGYGPLVRPTIAIVEEIEENGVWKNIIKHYRTVIEFDEDTEEATLSEPFMYVEGGGSSGGDIDGGDIDV